MTLDETTPQLLDDYRLLALTEEELCVALKQQGFPTFRGKQVFHWLHQRAERSPEAMQNLPKDIRAFLTDKKRLGGVRGTVSEKESTDGSIKFLFDLEDGRKVESVLMPGARQDAEKMTLCISSQVGCAVDCKFCVTGKNGFFRHMRPDEIVDQVLFAIQHLAKINDGRIVRNIVFMGMGEPLLNTEAVIRSIRVLTAEKGAGISPRRITVSTSGIVPGMEELAKADLGVGLAISLNAPNNQLRNDIMPINKKYPLEQLLEVCRRFPLRGHQRVTFEYVLIKNFNTEPEHTRQIARLLHGVTAKVNLIPFNPDPMLPYERPDEETIDSFYHSLKDRDVFTTIRWSKALDVSGACGQLAGQYRQRGEDGKMEILPRE